MANKLFTDQLGRKVDIPFPPKRIVSLVPSQTELLHYLGLEEEVAGITKFCIHPDQWFRHKTRIGGTKQLHIDKIKALQPDLIITNKEENEQLQVETLMQHFPVWTSDIHTLEEACAMIEQVGAITGKATAALQLSQTIQLRFAALPRNMHPADTAYFIWRDPWMVAGGDTFIHHMLERCGLRNIFAQQPRYPSIELDAIKQVKLVLLSSEPYPFKEQHIAYIKTKAPDAQVKLVDGEMFSWYGSRLLYAPDYFSQLLSSL